MKKAPLIVCVGAALMLAGCAESQQARRTQTSGFLGGDYEKLREGNEGEALLVFREPEAD